MAALMKATSWKHIGLRSKSYQTNQRSVCESYKWQPRPTVFHLQHTGNYQQRRTWIRRPPSEKMRLEGNLEEEVELEDEDEEDWDEDEEHDRPQWEPLFPHELPPKEIWNFTELLKVGRHVKVTPAGRVVSFSAFVMLGNQEGSAGLGYGKAKTTDKAMQRAYVDAQKHILHIYRYKGRTLMKQISLKYGATKIIIRPNGKHITLGPLKLVLFARAFGLQDITIKVHGSRNPINMMKAFLQAMILHTQDPYDQARLQGKTLVDMRKIWYPQKYFNNVYNHKSPHKSKPPKLPNLERSVD